MTRLRRKSDTKEVLRELDALVVLDPKTYKGRWKEFFGNDHPIHVELGMGKGKFISEMSARNRNINFIGIDMYDELVRKASEKAVEIWGGKHGSHPDNLGLALCNIEYITEYFSEGEIERIYLNFSDPWPKKRHARRRLTHPRFAQNYLRLLNEKGEIHLKTDSLTLFEFSLNSFADMGLRMRNIALDLHQHEIASELVMTEYEQKFAGQGMNIYRCEVLTGETALAEHLRRLKQRVEDEANE
jgi:tRNA (guanine-N7-)-methyltransferase